MMSNIVLWLWSCYGVMRQRTGLEAVTQSTKNMQELSWNFQTKWWYGEYFHIMVLVTCYFSWKCDFEQKKYPEFLYEHLQIPLTNARQAFSCRTVHPSTLPRMWLNDLLIEISLFSDWPGKSPDFIPNKYLRTILKGERLKVDIGNPAQDVHHWGIGRKLSCHTSNPLQFSC